MAITASVNMPELMDDADFRKNCILNLMPPRKKDMPNTSRRLDRIEPSKETWNGGFLSQTLKQPPQNNNARPTRTAASKHSNRFTSKTQKQRADLNQPEEILSQGEDGDNHLRRIAERRVEEAADCA